MASVFFSYSHKDQAIRDELETHLALFKRQGIISAWHDRRIEAGGHLHDEISEHLKNSEIVLVLVSANFFASDYCFDNEMQSALTREKAGECTVIPVIVKPCQWTTSPLGHLRATPTDGIPISKWPDQDEALSLVAADIKRATDKYSSNENKSSLPSPTSLQPEQPATNGLPRSSNLRVKRTFSDQEKDAFVAETFEFIARYFEGSLAELGSRNSHLSGRFQRLDKRAIIAAIYDSGKKVAACSVWYGGSSFGKGVSFSNSDAGPGNSYNEMLFVEEDGYLLSWKAGLAFHGGDTKRLSEEGAAEHLWSMLIRALQD